MEQTVQDPAEQQKHEDAIDHLCKEYPGQEDLVRRHYLEVLERVSDDATIRTFLTILISREVKTLLKIRQLTETGP